MRVTVFGASGAIGRLVVQRLLGDGHQVTALVRTPAKLALVHSHLTVVTGQLADRDAVEQAVSGADAVISALGPKVDRFIGLATPSLRGCAALSRTGSRCRSSSRTSMCAVVRVWWSAEQLRSSFAFRSTVTSYCHAHGRTRCSPCHPRGLRRRCRHLRGAVPRLAG
ncbi:NAD(P)-dependent oxidoreductase [Streptomyces akebiae]|uniref:SDR family oxidoreductase n=1 Tax=Streptomyces akebiae TaxID=2865673 RepID=A0ABX8XK08_9ACTN|nr:NAD(P)-binding oxidoreductase [Streptomyces akebiae]QYX75937.1 SDR family oxidoreductase [Streptomyces akebiae]